MASSRSAGVEEQLSKIHIQGVYSEDEPPKIIPDYLQPQALSLFARQLSTMSSVSSLQTLSDCLPLLKNPIRTCNLNRYGIPHLRREEHIHYIHSLLGTLPSHFQMLDASRPWLLYWTLNALSTLGENISSYRERLQATLQPIQNPTGGFGGGFGQYSHVACTYAAVLTLASVHGLELIDRKATWEWLGTLKQSDGSFSVAQGAEKDIRGAYCAMTVIALLNLPLELPSSAPARSAGLTTFTDKLGEWIGKCQSYEGGLGAAPGNEPHGAYAFCGLATLCIYGPPHESINKVLDTRSLTRWLASMQTGEGGFAGRTNKLVDACYSHWVGGCWSLLSAAQEDSSNRVLWNRSALVRYLLCCCQSTRPKLGGMRDKPSANPDAYHTCYSLAGLSAAVNTCNFRVGGSDASGARNLPAAFQWTARGATDAELEELLLERQDAVECVHPVFVIPFHAVEYAGRSFVGMGV
ncbi:terpenoid cyclases/Protein prenyltransferase [Piedraia hortae CBS 480.64]|uniref:Protein farnesyltransferase subunit beta n=1 Tax=Piedraia hortae CBS 480.64 TaxID=1314780 RepID=A0A6A7BQY1_9PEZI|nr:terpenoid cyclases/Protein prenyltransferase [Piedraia hortae CBS 480.64]